MIQKMKKTSLSKRMMNMVQKRRIKADVKPKESKYRHKCLTEEYSLESAQIITMMMLHTNNTLAIMDNLQACIFLKTYSLKHVVKKFGEKGMGYAHKNI